MSASLSGVFNLQSFTDLGALMAGGRLYTFAPSTTTQKTAYTDAAGSIAQTYTSDGLGGQYIALNSRGELPTPLFLTSGGYDITLKTSAGVTVWTRRAIGVDENSSTLRADLASTSDATKGAGQIGFDEATDYVGDTVGAFLHKALTLVSDDQVIQGREYATPFSKGLIDSVPQKIVMSGDSTTFGDTAPVGGRIWEILPQVLRHRGLWADFSVVNAGHSGNGTVDWLSTWLAADLATNPTVYIIRWGLNDPVSAISAATTISNIKTGLQTIRTAKPTPSDMVVILMSPNSCDDDPAGRTAAWNREVAAGLQLLARQYQCAYIDTGRYLLDASMGVWINEDYFPGSSRYVHPLTTGNELFASLIADTIFNEGVSKHLGRSHVTNQAGPLSIKVATDLLDTYDFGYSLYPASTGFPYQGVVQTFKQASGFGMQFNYLAASAADPIVGMRISLSGGGWSVWTKFGRGAAQTITLSNAWTEYVVGEPPYSYTDGDEGVIDGLIKPGTLTDGTALFTLPVGRRSLRNYWRPVATSTGTAKVYVRTTGVVEIWGAAGVAWVDLSAVRFLLA